jgi:cytochrome c5
VGPKLYLRKDKILWTGRVVPGQADEFSGQNVKAKCEVSHGTDHESAPEISNSQQWNG